MLDPDHSGGDMDLDGDSVSHNALDGHGKYITQACDFCKQRHLRCDGQQPCVHCSKRGKTCRYAPLRTKRGPKPRSKSQSHPLHLAPRTVLTPQPPRGANIPAILRHSSAPSAAPPSSAPQVDPAEVAEVLRVFDESVVPLVHNNFQLSLPRAVSLWSRLLDSEPVRPPSTPDELPALVEQFVYALVLAHGSGVRGDEVRASALTARGVALMQALFFTPWRHSPDQMAPYADDLVAGMVYLILLLVQADEFNFARLCVIEGYNLLNQHVHGVTPHVAHRLLTHLAGMSRSTQDMVHWVTRAHLLGPDAATPVNRVLLALFFCSPGMLRDPLNRPIPVRLHVPAQPLREGGDAHLYQLMLRELDETEAALDEAAHELSQGHVAGTRAMRTTPAAIGTFRFIVASCRALVLAQCGWREAALAAAERGLQLAQAHVGPTFWIVPLALAYCGLVARSLAQPHLAQDALTLLRRYAPRFPLTLRMMDMIQRQD